MIKNTPPPARLTFGERRLQSKCVS
jgi:hypothetical protein